MRLIGSRKIERKLSTGGDQQKARNLVGYAESLLVDLEERLRNSAAGIWMDSITKEVKGGYVKCTTILHLTTREPYYQEIEIYVAPPGGVQEEKNYKCPCNCNFSKGTILAVEQGDTDLYPILTVTVCANEEWYVTYENIIGSDFTPWEEGMSVTVMAYHDFLFDCCNFNTNATGCAPIEDIDNEPHSDDWRPVVRVLPFCSKLSKWEEIFGAPVPNSPIDPTSVPSGQVVITCGEFSHKLMRLYGRSDFNSIKVTRATIDTIYRLEGTADVTLTYECEGVSTEGIEFFYHCQYSNGSEEDLKKGHRAFEEDDDVYLITIAAEEGAVETYIFGHADIPDIRECSSEYVVVRLEFISSIEDFSAAEKTYVTVYDPDADENLLVWANNLDGELIPISFPLQVAGPGTDQNLVDIIEPLFVITDTAAGGDPWTTGDVDEEANINFPWTTETRAAVTGTWSYTEDTSEITVPATEFIYGIAHLYWSDHECSGFGYDKRWILEFGGDGVYLGSNPYDQNPIYAKPVEPSTDQTSDFGNYTYDAGDGKDYSEFYKKEGTFSEWNEVGPPQYYAWQEYEYVQGMYWNHGINGLGYLYDFGDKTSEFHYFIENSKWFYDDTVTDGFFRISLLKEYYEAQRFELIQDGTVEWEMCTITFTEPIHRRILISDSNPSGYEAGQNLNIYNCFAPWEESSFYSPDLHDEGIYHKIYDYYSGTTEWLDYIRTRDGSLDLYSADCKVWIGEYGAYAVAAASAIKQSYYYEINPMASGVYTVDPTFGLCHLEHGNSCSIVDFTKTDLESPSDVRINNFISSGTRENFQKTVSSIFDIMASNIKINCQFDSVEGENSFIDNTELKLNVYAVKRVTSS